MGTGIKTDLFFTSHSFPSTSSLVEWINGRPAPSQSIPAPQSSAPVTSRPRDIPSLATPLLNSPSPLLHDRPKTDDKAAYLRLCLRCSPHNFPPPIDSSASASTAATPCQPKMQQPTSQRQHQNGRLPPNSPTTSLLPTNPVLKPARLTPPCIRPRRHSAVNSEVNMRAVWLVRIWTKANCNTIQQSTAGKSEGGGAR